MYLTRVLEKFIFFFRNEQLLRLFVFFFSEDRIVFGDNEELWDKLLDRNAQFKETMKQHCASFVGHRLGKYFSDIEITFEI